MHDTREDLSVFRRIHWSRLFTASVPFSRGMGGSGDSSGRCAPAGGVQ